METNIENTATNEQENYSAVSKLAYKKFQLQWMLDHGFGVDDLCNFAQTWAEANHEEHLAPQEYTITEALADSGLGAGSLWPCFDEFLTCEYQDVALMKSLLGKKKHIEYLEDIGRLRICRESDSLSEGEPCIERWNTVDGTLYRPGDIDEIQANDLPTSLQWLHTCGFYGNNLYLCSYGNCYGVAVVYEYPKSEAQNRGISMDDLFSCAIADAVQMASCDEAECVQIIAAECPGELYGTHEVMAFIPSTFPADQIRSAIQTFDCFAFKANYLDDQLYIGTANANKERIFVTTPAGAITAYKVGGYENPGIAVDFLPNGEDDYTSVVTEYTEMYRDSRDAEPKVTVQARIHLNSNSEPYSITDMEHKA